MLIASLNRGRLAVAILAGVCAVGLAPPAAAYRPFDGTDAAVADVGQVEIEFQGVGVVHAASSSFPAGPNAVINYGFAERWELVMQGEAQPFPEGAGPSNVANGVFLKYVIQPGVLQEKSGPSIAAEFGVLLPDPRGFGASWDGIVTQRWDWGTVHFNAEAALTPDQRGEAFFDAIIEGPSKWTVRPVAELYSDTVLGGPQTFSALVGAIWQVRDDLAFDVALRYAVVDGRPVDELRAGVTFAFPLNLGRPANEEAANPASPGRRVSPAAAYASSLER